MRITSSALVLVTLVAAAGPAGAKRVDGHALVGTWAGTMAYRVGKDEQKAQVTLAFSADGKLVIWGGKDVTQTVGWRVEVDHVLLIDPKRTGNDVKLTDVRVSDLELKATVVPLRFDPGTQEPVSITLALRRTDR